MIAPKTQLRLQQEVLEKKFGRLTVLSLKEHPGGRFYFNCVCDCGKETVVSGTRLRNGQTKSCGCLRSNNLFKTGNLHHGWRGYGEISGSMIKSIKSRAKANNIEYNLTEEYLNDLFIKQNKLCNISGIPICFSPRSKRNASLDRIDSSIGYIEGNVQWLHKDINFMKYTFSMDVFINYCRLILENQDKLTIKND